MDKETPTVSVVIPVLNAERALGALLESLRLQSYPTERTEIIMVDNGSTDASPEIISSQPGVKALFETSRRSPGAARNKGIRHSKGEIIALIDADCRAHPDWLTNGIKKLVGDGLDRVAGKVEFLLSPKPNIYEIFDSQRNFRQEDFISGGWSGTGNLFVRRRTFDEVGLFDPRLRSHEDQEWGLRATRAGKSLAFESGAIVYHPARKTLRSIVKKWMRTEFGAGQVFRHTGMLELQLWYKKANYRPLSGTWRIFPETIHRSSRVRFQIDLLSNIMRYAGNIGNLLGYMFPGGFGGSSPKETR